MSKIDPAKTWGNVYRMVSTLIRDVAPEIGKLDLEVKELFLLAEIDEYPFPAEIADRCTMPKPTVTVYLKRLEAAGFVKREIDPGDLRRHKITLTPAGRKVVTKGLAMLSEAFGVRLNRLTSSEQASFLQIIEKMS
jgi:DNA-binding MarR family transcriptional regulator